MNQLLNFPEANVSQTLVETSVESVGLLIGRGLWSRATVSSNIRTQPRLGRNVSRDVLGLLGFSFQI